MDDSERGERIRFLDKPINFRPILFCALSFGAGILIFGKFAADKRLAAWIVVAFLAAVLLLSFPFCIKYPIKYYIATSVAVILFCVAGFFYADYKFEKFGDSQIPDGDYLVSGEVENVIGRNGYYGYTLKNCTYNGKKGGSLYVGGCKTKFDKYDKINVVCSVRVENLYQGSGVSSHVIYGQADYTEKIIYTELVGKSNSPRADFARKTDEIFGNMSKESAGIAKALICGDAEGMGDNIDAFRLSGLAHVFAVSGMHVGLIFAAVSFAIKRIPIKKIYKSLIVCSILYFYSYLCGLTASSLRAATMCSFIAIAGAIGEKKDRINSISVAAIVVLLINPFDLFAKGFILSFSVSFGLIVLTSPLKRAFSFMTKKLGDALSVTVAAEATSIPLSVYFFGYFPLVAIVTNLFLIPLVSIGFYMLWICFIVCAILPINRLIALFIPDKLFSLLADLCEVFADFPYKITVFPTAVAVLFYGAVLISSEFVNADSFTKKTTGIYAIVAVIVAIAFSVV